MPNIKQIKKEILQYFAAAAEEARQIRECSSPDLDHIHTHLRRYILNKYMLSSDSVASDNIQDLIDASLAQTMKVDPSLVAELDAARSCAGATSAMVKKALLFQAMERELEIDLPADKAINALTIRDLADIVLNCMLQKTKDIANYQ